MDAGQDGAARGRPVGRRLFLGLLGAGAAGLVVTRFSFAADDATADNLGTPQPMPPGGQQLQQEGLIGQHPNRSFDELMRRRRRERARCG